MTAPTIFTPELCMKLNSNASTKKKSSENEDEDIKQDLIASKTSSLKQFALEVIRNVAQGNLKPSTAPFIFRLAEIQPESENRIVLDLADALWFVWLEIEVLGDEPKNHLADLVKELMKTSFVTKRVLMEVSEGEFMEWSGLVVNYRDGWRKKEIRSNTRNIYTQRKYNLLREESEGYSKIITFLNQLGAGALQIEHIDAALNSLKSLIGFFDLDPNRVCSLVIDAFSAQPHNDAFIGLFSAFSASALSQLLGFHFSRQPRPPGGLYTVAAKLLKEKYVTLEALTAHLSPKDDDVAAEWKAGVAEMAAAVKKIGVISLNTPSVADAPGASQQQQSSIQSPLPPSGGAAGSASTVVPMKKTYVQTAATLQLNPHSYSKLVVGQHQGTDKQRIALVAALFQVDAWDIALKSVRWLKALGVDDIAIYPNVGRALCSILAKEIEPQYDHIYNGGVCQQLIDQSGIPSTADASKGEVHLSERAITVLRLIGHHLYHDISTLTKFIRILGKTLQRAHTATTTATTATATTTTTTTTTTAATTSSTTLPPSTTIPPKTPTMIIDLISAHILPAMSLIPANTPLVLEIWHALMKHIPYHERFSLYGDLKQASASSLLLQASSKLAETETRRILRRVTAPTNKKDGKMAMRPLGRMLAKIAHANPMAVSEQLLRQVMGMSGMVASIAESLKFLTPGAFDVLTFAIIRQLASSKRKLKDDGINLEEWYQWLAAFSGIVSRKHESVEVTAIAQYVANQLKSSESLDILVLWELVSTMTGIAPVFDVSEGQLDALAGSGTLLSQVISQSDGGGGGDNSGGGGNGSSGKYEYMMQRNTQRLYRALSVGDKDHQLALPLLILLAQQRKLITLNPPSSHLKLVAELYDKCQEVTVQYAEFLRRALSIEEYSALMPSLSELAVEYRFDPEIIFELHRPLIKHIVPPIDGLYAVGGSGSGIDGDDRALVVVRSDGSIVAGTSDPAPTEGMVVDANTKTSMDEDEEGEIEAGSDKDLKHGEKEKGEEEKGATKGMALTSEAQDTAAKDIEDGEMSEEEEGALAMDATPGSIAARVHAFPLNENKTTSIEIVFKKDEWDALIAQTAVLAPENGFKGMSQTLFVTFWALSLYDVDVPVARYESTLNQLKSTIRTLRDDINAARRDAQRGLSTHAPAYGGGYHHHQPPPPPPPVADVESLNRELERLEGAAARLPVEMKEQKENAAYMNARLHATCHSWVVDENIEAQAAAAREFVQFCILPRVLNSPSDALYCARFLGKAHMLGPSRFRFLTVLDRIFRELGYLVRCSTPREATNLGIFFAELTSMITRWRNATTYEAECAGSDAFTSYKSSVLTPVSHTEYMHLTANWHKKLTLDVFCRCLSSADYMQMKNALLVLNRMVRIYPATRIDAKELLRTLAPIRDKDPREDLKTLARMYCTALEMVLRDAKNRSIVDTRQEYAGMKPPPRPRKAPSVADKTETKGDEKKDGPSSSAVPIKTVDAKIIIKESEDRPRHESTRREKTLRADASEFRPRSSDGKRDRPESRNTNTNNNNMEARAGKEKIRGETERDSKRARRTEIDQGTPPSATPVAIATAATTTATPTTADNGGVRSAGTTTADKHQQQQTINTESTTDDIPRSGLSSQQNKTRRHSLNDKADQQKGRRLSKQEREKEREKEMREGGRGSHQKERRSPREAEKERETVDEDAKTKDPKKKRGKSKNNSKKEDGNNDDDDDVKTRNKGGGRHRKQKNSGEDITNTPDTNSINPTITSRMPPPPPPPLPPSSGGDLASPLSKTEQPQGQRGDDSKKDGTDATEQMQSRSVGRNREMTSPRNAAKNDESKNNERKNNNDNNMNAVHQEEPRGRDRRDQKDYRERNDQQQSQQYQQQPARTNQNQRDQQQEDGRSQNQNQRDQQQEDGRSQRRTLPDRRHHPYRRPRDQRQQQQQRDQRTHRRW